MPSNDVELATPIKPDHMTELRNAFAEFDKDSDGHITKDELSGIMNNFGHIINSQDLDKVMKLVDTDGKVVFVISSEIELHGTTIYLWYFGGVCFASI